jgi:beta-1,4-mannosyltransferase
VLRSNLTADRPASPSTSSIRVASVPASHVYVRHLAAPNGVDDGVRRLPDPPTSGRSQQSQWWPPRMLDADWVRRHRDEFDVFHVHFGFPTTSTAASTTSSSTCWCPRRAGSSR